MTASAHLVAAALSFAASAEGGDWTWREETVENPERKSPRIKSVYFASVEEAEVAFTFAASWDR